MSKNSATPQSSSQNSSLNDEDDDDSNPLTSSTTTWTWIGPPISFSKSTKYYNEIKQLTTSPSTSTTSSETIYKVGDNVKVYSNSKQPFLGRIIKLLEKNGTKSVIFQWYYRPNDFLKTHLNKLKISLYPNEIVLSDVEDSNSVDSIISLIQLKFYSESNVINEKYLATQPDEYVCRYWFGKKSQKEEKTISFLTPKQFEEFGLFRATEPEKKATMTEILQELHEKQKYSPEPEKAGATETKPKTTSTEEIDAIEHTEHNCSASTGSAAEISLAAESELTLVERQEISISPPSSPIHSSIQDDSTFVSSSLTLTAVEKPQEQCEDQLTSSPVTTVSTSSTSAENTVEIVDDVQSNHEKQRELEQLLIAESLTLLLPEAVAPFPPAADVIKPSHAPPSLPSIQPPIPALPPEPTTITSLTPNDSMATFTDILRRELEKRRPAAASEATDLVLTKQLLENGDCLIPPGSNLSDFLFTFQEIANKFPTQSTDLNLGCMYMCQQQSARLSTAKFKTRLELNKTLLANWRRKSYKEREVYCLKMQSLRPESLARKRKPAGYLDDDEDYLIPIKKVTHDPLAHVDHDTASTPPHSNRRLLLIPRSNSTSLDKQTISASVQIGDNYQANLPDLITPPNASKILSSSSNLIWAPNLDKETVNEYLSKCRCVLREMMNYIQTEDIVNSFNPNSLERNGNSGDGMTSFWSKASIANGIFLFVTTDFETNVLEILHHNLYRIPNAIQNVQEVVSSYIYKCNRATQYSMKQLYDQDPKNMRCYMEGNKTWNKKQIYDYATRFLQSGQYLRLPMAKSNCGVNNSTTQSLNSQVISSNGSNINVPGKSDGEETDFLDNISRFLEIMQRRLDNFTFTQLINSLILTSQKVITPMELLTRVKYLFHGFIQYLNDRPDTTYKDIAEIMADCLTKFLEFYPPEMKEWLHAIGYDQILPLSTNTTWKYVSTKESR